MTTYTCKKCGCTTDTNSFDTLVVTDKKGDHLGLVSLGTGDHAYCVDELNNSACPVCDGWEDGIGNTCNIDGWR